jgi:hypothetical protein
VFVLALLLAACWGATQTGSAPESVASDVTEPSPSNDVGLTYVALGDSWPEGGHCGGCRTFAALYADGLQKLTGEPVNFVHLTGDSVAADSTVLLASLRTDERTRAAVAKADVVMIATGPNEMGSAVEPSAAGTCGGSDDARCIRALGDVWASNFNASVEEIERLREGKPTAIRLVNAKNPFISGGALIFELLTDAVCDAAKAHEAKCVDVRPILNGPNLDEPTDENSAGNMQAIADALVATGLAELP